MLHANYSYVTFFAFQKRTIHLFLNLSLSLNFSQKKFSSFLHILYKDQIKLVTTILWSLKKGLVTSCIYYTRTKVNLYLTHCTTLFFGKQDSLSCFTFTYFDSSIVDLFVILTSKVEVSISHSCKARLLWFLFQSPPTI